MDRKYRTPTVNYTLTHPGCGPRGSDLVVQWTVAPILGGLPLVAAPSSDMRKLGPWLRMMARLRMARQ